MAAQARMGIKRCGIVELTAVSFGEYVDTIISQVKQ